MNFVSRSHYNKFQKVSFIRITTNRQTILWSLNMAYQDRKFKRRDSKNLLNYACVDENGNETIRGMGRTMDISQNGIRLETHISIEPYNKIILTIGLEDDLFDVAGKIIYSRKEKDGTFQTGIEFRSSDKTGQEILKKFIKDLTKNS